ncbi:MAG: recombination protein RecR [Candidatus Tokpelaia sp. JSC188]|nr:MAG: recombination protein RecR [Candidatus Tokpelaia sp. JSC188]
MSKYVAGPEIERLIQLLARVPGLGPRSARRAALQLIKKKETLLQPLSQAMQVAIDAVQICSICSNIDTVNPCLICKDERRDSSILIVVEDVSDLWALERARVMRTYYHVLGGRFSPLDGVGPNNLNIKKLLDRLTDSSVKELILAINATVEGQTIAHYITNLLVNFDVKVSRLARGIPIGGELDYFDDGTLAAALLART